MLRVVTVFRCFGWIAWRTIRSKLRSGIAGWGLRHTTRVTSGRPVSRVPAWRECRVPVLFVAGGTVCLLRVRVFGIYPKPMGNGVVTPQNCPVFLPTVVFHLPQWITGNSGFATIDRGCQKYIGMPPCRLLNDREAGILCALIFGMSYRQICLLYSLVA